MWYLIMGGLLVFTGFYLLVKIVLQKKKGIQITARLTGYSQENGTNYPAFTFTHEGQEFTITGGSPVNNPDKYKYQVGDNVDIIYVPGNTKYVTVVGSRTEVAYGIASIIIGALLMLYYFAR